MGTRKKGVFTVLILVLTGFGTFACASSRVNLVESGRITIERLPAEQVYISKATVHQDGPELIITGRVKRRTVSASDGGHVDIAVIHPGGKILKKISTSYVPRILRRKGTRESSFTVRLHLLPPEGSIVRVAYHQLSVSKGMEFDCGSNAAGSDGSI